MAEQAELLIALRDEVSKQMAAITQSMKGLNKTVADGNVDRNSFSAKLADIGKQALVLTGLTGSLTGSLYMLHKATASAFEGLQDNRIEATFNSLNGGAEAAAVQMQRLRTAVGGAFDDQEVQAFANRMTDLRLDIDDTYSILTLARGRALRTGEQELSIAESLGRSIARGTTRSIEQYGIVIDSAQAQKEYAASLGLTAKQLSDVQRREANRLAIMEQVRGVAAVSATDGSWLEASAGSWANQVSGMKQGLADLLDPVQVLKREGADLAGAFSPLKDSAMSDLRAAQDQVVAATRAYDELKEKTAGMLMPGGAHAEGAYEERARLLAEAQAAVVRAEATTQEQLRRTADAYKSVAADSETYLATIRKVQESTLDPGRLDPMMQQLEGSMATFRQLRDVVSASGAPELESAIEFTIRAFEAQLDAARERQHLLEVAGKSSFEAYSRDKGLIEDLAQREAVLSDQEKERLANLRAMAKAYEGFLKKVLLFPFYPQVPFPDS